MQKPFKAGLLVGTFALTGSAFAPTAQAGGGTFKTVAFLNGGYTMSGVTFDSSGNLFGTTENGGPADVGTVYEIAKGSSTVTTVATFNGPNGNHPSAGVTFDSSGNLFGTTEGGGTNSSGNVYEIAKGSSTVTSLASFTYGVNGFSPSGLTLDSSGNLFGTTDDGGTGGGGNVFEVAKGSSTVKELTSFSGPNGKYPLGGVTFDSSGNLFGTTQEGGANDFGTVFEVAKGSSTVTTVATFNGPNGDHPSAGVTFDGSGNLFGTTGAGGTDNRGTVFEIAKGSSTVMTLASFSGPGAQDPSGLTLDGSGDLFGTTFDGGAAGFGSVFEVAKGSGAITTLVSFNFSNGSDPYGGLTFDRSGDLFGTTHSTVFEIAGVAPSPVPESSSALALGLLLALGLGGMVVAAKRKKRVTLPT